MAVAGKMLDHRHLRLFTHPADQTLPAPRNRHVDILGHVQEMAHRLPIRRSHQLHRMVRQAHISGRLGQNLRDRSVRVRRLLAAAQNHRVATLHAQRGGVGRHVRPRLVDEENHPQRHAHLQHLQPVRTNRRRHHLADRVRQLGHLVHRLGDPVDPLRRQSQPIDPAPPSARNSAQPPDRVGSLPSAPANVRPIAARSVPARPASARPLPRPFQLTPAWRGAPPARSIRGDRCSRRKMLPRTNLQGVTLMLTGGPPNKPARGPAPGKRCHTASQHRSIPFQAVQVNGDCRCSHASPPVVTRCPAQLSVQRLRLAGASSAAMAAPGQGRPLPRTTPAPAGRPQHHARGQSAPPEGPSPEQRRSCPPYDPLLGYPAPAQ